MFLYCRCPVDLGRCLTFSAEKALPVRLGPEINIVDPGFAYSLKGSASSLRRFLVGFFGRPFDDRGRFLNLVIFPNNSAYGRLLLHGLGGV